MPIKFDFPCTVCFYRSLTKVGLMGMFNYIMIQKCEYAKVAQFLLTPTDDNIFF